MKKGLSKSPNFCWRQKQNSSFNWFTETGLLLLLLIYEMNIFFHRKNIVFSLNKEKPLIAILCVNYWFSQNAK